MKKILVVDDEEILRMLIMDTLEDLGYEIEEAIDGQMGLEKIESMSYDLVILDYMMPYLTGVEVLENLSAEARKDIKVLMLTAKTQESDRQQMLQAGADYFMAKPFSPIDLMSVVEGILQ